MEIWLFLHLLIVLFLITMLHVLRKKTMTEAKKYFIYSVFFLTLWVLFDFVVNIAPMPIASFFSVLVHFVVSMGAATFFLSCVSFKGKPSTRDFAFAFLAVYLLFPALFDFHLKHNSFGPYLYYSLVWYAWLAAVSLVIIGGLLTLMSLREHVDITQAMRRKLDFFVAGTALVFILPVITTVLVQLIDFPQVSSLLSFIGLGIAYRTFKK